MEYVFVKIEFYYRNNRSRIAVFSGLLWPSCRTRHIHGLCTDHCVYEMRERGRERDGERKRERDGERERERGNI